MDGSNPWHVLHVSVWYRNGKRLILIELNPVSWVWWQITSVTSISGLLPGALQALWAPNRCDLSISLVVDVCAYNVPSLLSGSYNVLESSSFRKVQNVYTRALQSFNITHIHCVFISICSSSFLKVQHCDIWVCLYSQSISVCPKLVYFFWEKV